MCRLLPVVPPQLEKRQESKVRVSYETKEEGVEDRGEIVCAKNPKGSIDFTVIISWIEWTILGKSIAIGEDPGDHRKTTHAIQDGYNIARYGWSFHHALIATSTTIS